SRVCADVANSAIIEALNNKRMAYEPADVDLDPSRRDGAPGQRRPVGQGLPVGELPGPVRARGAARRRGFAVSSATRAAKLLLVSRAVLLRRRLRLPGLYKGLLFQPIEHLRGDVPALSWGYHLLRSRQRLLAVALGLWPQFRLHPWLSHVRFSHVART